MAGEGEGLEIAMAPSSPAVWAIEPAGVKKEVISCLRLMRALTFFLALMVGLAMAFIAPAMAGGHDRAPEAMTVPVAAEISPEPVDQLAADLLSGLEFNLAPSLDGAAA
jgi:hypothetical protein